MKTISEKEKQMEQPRCPECGHLRSEHGSYGCLASCGDSMCPCYVKNRDIPLDDATPEKEKQP